MPNKWQLSLGFTNFQRHLVLGFSSEGQTLIPHLMYIFLGPLQQRKPPLTDSPMCLPILYTAKQNYDVDDQELLAVRLALEECGTG